jgi:hypothetical protein
MRKTTFPLDSLLWRVMAVGTFGTLQRGVVMRHIPTSAAQVENLKKQAKRLQRKGGGKHTELLDRVARSAGYDHWHHVTQCQQFYGAAAEGADVLRNECEMIVKACEAGISKAVVTGPEVGGDRPFILLSVAPEDAWLLEPREKVAVALRWNGVNRPIPVRSNGHRVEVEFESTFYLSEDIFMFKRFDHQEIDGELDGGITEIRGYPVKELRELILKIQTFDQTVEDVFVQSDTVEITDEIAARLIARGFLAADLEQAKAAGASYSPSRDSILYPTFFNGDEPPGP